MANQHDPETLTLLERLGTARDVTRALAKSCRDLTVANDRIEVAARRVSAIGGRIRDELHQSGKIRPESLESWTDATNTLTALITDRAKVLIATKDLPAHYFVAWRRFWDGDGPAVGGAE